VHLEQHLTIMFYNLKRAIVLVTITMLVSAPAFAYPIFYKCDANKQMTETLTGFELSNTLAPLLTGSTEQKRTTINALHDHLAKCQTQLKQIQTAAGISEKDIEEQFNSQLNLLNLGHSINQDSSVGSDELSQQIEKNAFEESACRNTIRNLPVSAFHNDKDNVLIYYPHAGPYSYVTGCKHDSGYLGYPDWIQWECNPIKHQIIKKIISNAIVGGVDPYFFLAISFLENQSQYIQDLYLDPIGIVSALGCNVKEVGSQEKHSFESFSTFYDVSSGVINDSKLAQKIVSSFDLNGISQSNGESYYCVDTSNTGVNIDSYIKEHPGQNQCCLKLPKKLTNQDQAAAAISEVRNQLLVKFAGNIQATQSTGKNDPAFRIQHFNGFSRLTGRGETVSPFRTGINLYKTPIYGYQGMDFVLNSFMSNPYINSLVDAAMKEVHSNYKSILCQDVPVPGVYQIDSDYYYEKFRDAPRLEGLKGKSWATMTAGEKQVMDQELSDNSVYFRWIKYFNLKEQLIGTRLKNLANNVTVQMVVDYYFKEIYQSRNTPSKASPNPWGDLKSDQLNLIIKNFNSDEGFKIYRGESY